MTTSSQGSSGFDGSKCTPDKQWNQSVWDSFNGSTCNVQGLLPGDVKISDTLDSAACGQALSAYRNETQFTCYYTSDYSYLPGTDLR